MQEGSVLALVGPNGAGKTTLLRRAAALDAPTEGQIKVAGLDTQDDPRGVHAALGYLPDFFGLYRRAVGPSLPDLRPRSRGVSEREAHVAVDGRGCARN